MVREENHITLAEGLTVHVKDWEGSILGKPVYQINLNRLEEETEMEESFGMALYDFLAKFKSQSLWTARINTSNAAGLRILQKLDFLLMECYVLLKHDLAIIPAPASRFNIRPFNEDDVPVLEQIAARSFVSSRFHMDPLIPQEVARLSRSEWVKNSCAGRADGVFVAEADVEQAGFVICNIKTKDLDKFGILDLIAVAPKYQGQKIGFDLTVSFLDFCAANQLGWGLVGTQAHNITSIRTYERTGFLFSESFYSFHKHIDDKGI